MGSGVEVLLSRSFWGCAVCFLAAALIIYIVVCDRKFTQNDDPERKLLQNQTEGIKQGNLTAKKTE